MCELAHTQIGFYGTRAGDIQSDIRQIPGRYEADVDFGGESAVPLITDHPNLLVCRRYRSRALWPGWRVGYALGGVGLIEALRCVAAKDRSPPRVGLARRYHALDFTHSNPYSGNWPSFPSRHATPSPGRLWCGSDVEIFAVRHTRQRDARTPTSLRRVRFLADQGQDERAVMRRGAMFEQKDPLPGAEL
jgi:hypothetical protein